MNFKPYKITTGCFWLVCILISFLVLCFPPANPLTYDVYGYYMYLPLAFKYHDLTLHNFDAFNQLFNQYHPSETLYQALKWDNGNWVMRYPSGTALLYSPFYLIADLIAPHTSYPADGFSRPYQLANVYGGLFYTLSGLYFIKKILARFFSDKVSAVTFLAVALGTNYFFHVSVHGQGQMTHNVLFTLYAAIIYLTIRWHESYKTKHIVLLGLSIGLATLCRASEIICLFIPLLYGVTNLQSLKEKINLLLRHYKQVLLLAFVIALVGSVQLIYYKYTSGHFFINPYSAGNPGEGFEFLHPHIVEVLFSFRKGWFVYTPLMFFIAAGFFFLYKNNRGLFWPLLIYCLINLYIVSSWSCWWFGSCFGNRALICSYAALSIPLGYFIDYAFRTKIKILYLSLTGLFIALNLFQSWQMKEGIIDAANMSRPYYFSVFLQTRLPSDEQRKLLLQGKFNSNAEIFDREDSLTHRLGYAQWNTYENTRLFVSDVYSHGGKHSLILSPHTFSCDSIVASVKNITQKSYTWIKASAWVYSDDFSKNKNAWLEIHLTHKNWIYKPVKYFVSSMNFKNNSWNKLEYYYLVPDDLRSTKDKVCVYFFNTGKPEIYLDDLMLQSFEPVVDQSVF